MTTPPTVPFDAEGIVREPARVLIPRGRAAAEFEPASYRVVSDARTAAGVRRKRCGGMRVSADGGGGGAAAARQSDNQCAWRPTCRSSRPPAAAPRPAPGYNQRSHPPPSDSPRPFCTVAATGYRSPATDRIARRDALGAPRWADRTGPRRRQCDTLPKPKP